VQDCLWYRLGTKGFLSQQRAAWRVVPWSLGATWRCCRSSPRACPGMNIQVWRDQVLQWGPLVRTIQVRLLSRPCTCLKQSSCHVGIHGGCQWESANCRAEHPQRLRTPLRLRFPEVSPGVRGRCSGSFHRHRTSRGHHVWVHQPLQHMQRPAPGQACLCASSPILVGLRLFISHPQGQWRWRII